MQISEIREFVYLAEELNFSATAKAFYLSQSALSKHIASLEKDVGSQLLVRNNHSVRLTDVGSIFYASMVEVLKKFDEAMEHVKRTQSGFSSTLRIGYLYEATRDFFLPACSKLHSAAPNLGIDTMAYEAEEVLAALKREMIDVGITVLPADKDFGKYQVRKIKTLRFFIVLAASNKLSKKPSITCQDLANTDVLFPNPNIFPELSAYLHRQLKDTPIIHCAVNSAYDSKSIAPFLTMFGGASLILEHSIADLDPVFKIFELQDVDLSLDLSVIWDKSQTTNAIIQLADCIDEVLLQEV